MAPSPDCGTQPTYWYDDGDVLIEVDTGAEDPDRYRVHRVVLATRSEFFRSLFRDRHGIHDGQHDLSTNVSTKVVIRDDSSRFRLFLDWVYEERGRQCGDKAVLYDMFALSERYKCHGMAETCRNVVRLLPCDLILLRIAFEYRLDLRLCCRVMAWAIQQPQIKSEILCSVENSKQPWKLYLTHLAALFERVNCKSCRMAVVKAVANPAWDGRDEGGCGPGCTYLHKRQWALAKLCPLSMKRLFG